MKLSTLLLSLSLFAPVFAGKVITYTATSNLSQEDANNAAMAGVAKQIVSEVDASQTITKSEVTQGGKSDLKENFFSSNNVSSNLKLKGISVVPVKTDGKNFSATASLDLDEFTADIQFRMKQIREDVAKYEAHARESLNDRKYGAAAKDIQSAQDLIPVYNRLLGQLSQVYPLNDSHRLLHNIPEAEALLISRLSKVRLTGPTEEFTLSKSEMPEWQVLANDDQGPLPEFPILIKQGKQTILEKRTAGNGIANILLRKVNFENGPYTIDVFPNIPIGMARAAGIDQGIQITYNISKHRCEIQLKCNQIANLCNALEISLSQKSIIATKEETAPKLEATFSSSEKNSLTSGSTTLKSYDLTLTLKGENINFMVSAKGAGKNEIDAAIKAVQKIDFSDLQQQLKPYCK